VEPRAAPSGRRQPVVWRVRGKPRGGSRSRRLQRHRMSTCVVRQALSPNGIADKNSAMQQCPIPRNAFRPAPCRFRGMWRAHACLQCARWCGSVWAVCVRVYAARGGRQVLVGGGAVVCAVGGEGVRGGSGAVGQRGENVASQRVRA